MKRKIICVLMILLMFTFTGCSLRQEYNNDIEYEILGMIKDYSKETGMLTVWVVISDYVYYEYEDEYPGGEYFVDGYYDYLYEPQYMLSEYERTFDISGPDVMQYVPDGRGVVRIYVKNGKATKVESADIKLPVTGGSDIL